MTKLPKAIRFFRKPDHISFLLAYSIIIISSLINSFEMKLASTVFFTFTLCFELYEISKGNRDIVKLDHITFVVGYIMLIVSFWYDLLIIIIPILILFGFTLVYEIYRVRVMDIKNLNESRKP